MSMRNSIVSQNSNTGKVETSIINEETPFNGDSGSVKGVNDASCESEKVLARLIASLSLPGELVFLLYCLSVLSCMTVYERVYISSCSHLFIFHINTISPNVILYFTIPSNHTVIR